LPFAATTVTVTAGATPVLLVTGGGNARPRSAIIQNVTTPVGSLALVAFTSGTGVPTLGFQWAGTQPFSIEARRGQDLYVGVVSSIVDQKLSILMDLL
jgi:hypothetical protein